MEEVVVLLLFEQGLVLGVAPPAVARATANGVAAITMTNNGHYGSVLMHQEHRNGTGRGGEGGTEAEKKETREKGKGGEERDDEEEEGEERSKRREGVRAVLGSCSDRFTVAC